MLLPLLCFGCCCSFCAILSKACAIVSNGCQWTFRPFSFGDIPSVLNIENNAYEFPWSETIFRDCLTGRYICRALFDVNNQLLAYAVISVAVEECHVLNICVSPEFQRLGIAEYFLKKLLNESVSLGAKHAFLEVRASNVSALALYSKLGFSQAGRRKLYYQGKEGREDALVLSLPLILSEI